MSDVDPRKDPRFRPFRAAAYGVHILVSAIFCLWIIVNVSRSVAAMTPERLPPAGRIRCSPSGSAWMARRPLWTDLETQRETLVRTAPASSVDQEWMRFRTAGCSACASARAGVLSSPASEQSCARCIQRLEEVQDLYTIHAVQYAGEVGGAVDALQAAFDAARRSSAAGHATLSVTLR